jgi:hypothetical protein
MGSLNYIEAASVFSILFSTLLSLIEDARTESDFNSVNSTLEDSSCRWIEVQGETVGIVLVNTLFAAACFLSMAGCFQKSYLDKVKNRWDKIRDSTSKMGQDQRQDGRILKTADGVNVSDVGTGVGGGGGGDIQMANLPVASFSPSRRSSSDAPASLWQMLHLRASMLSTHSIDFEASPAAGAAAASSNRQSRAFLAALRDETGVIEDIRKIRDLADDLLMLNEVDQKMLRQEIRQPPNEYDNDYPEGVTPVPRRSLESLLSSNTSGGGVDCSQSHVAEESDDEPSMPDDLGDAPEIPRASIWGKLKHHDRNSLQIAGVMAQVDDQIEEEVRRTRSVQALDQLSTEAAADAGEAADLNDSDDPLDDDDGVSQFPSELPPSDDDYRHSSLSGEAQQAPVPPSSSFYVAETEDGVAYYIDVLTSEPFWDLPLGGVVLQTVSDDEMEEDEEEE